MFYKIFDKKELVMNEVWYKIYVFYVVKKVQFGQFVIVRVFFNGERIFLIFVIWDREEGWIIFIIFVCGKMIMRMVNEFKFGDEIFNVVGLFGNFVLMEKFGRVLVIGFIMGIVEVFLIVRVWQEIGNEVIIFYVFLNLMVILREEFEQSVFRYIVEGFDFQFGWGMNEIVQEFVKRVIVKVREFFENEYFDMVFIVGFVGGQKVIFNVVKEYGILMYVDFYLIMVDVIGMCGVCCVIVGGEVKFVCIDGFGFDVYKVDWDELIYRMGFYVLFERFVFEYYLK